MKIPIFIKIDGDIFNVSNIQALSYEDKKNELGNDRGVYMLHIYMKDDMYYLAQSYNGIFKLSKKEYEDLMMYLSRVYTIGEMSKYNVTNNKIMLEIKNDEMKSENMMNNKIKLIIKHHYNGF